jgi:hypothetical protein
MFLNPLYSALHKGRVTRCRESGSHVWTNKSRDYSMTQMVNCGPPRQKLCFIGRTRSLRKLPYDVVFARWNKVVGGVAHILPIVSYAWSSVSSLPHEWPLNGLKHVVGILRIYCTFCHTRPSSVSEDCDPVPDRRRGSGLGFNFRTTPGKNTPKRKK